MVMASLIDDLNNKITTEGATFAQHYLLNKWIKVFGQRAPDLSINEMNQVDHWNCFSPISFPKMSPTERRKAHQTNKRMATTKRGRTLSNSSTREHYAKSSY
jgi:hypothetical protein